MPSFAATVPEARQVTQRKDAEEAERHATTALGLRWDRGSQLAGEDRALIALIGAQRAALRS